MTLHKASDKKQIKNEARKRQKNNQKYIIRDK